MASSEELVSLVAAQAELTKIELRQEVAEAIAKGIQLQSDRPVVERGGTEILYGDVVGVGDGYVSVQFPDQVDPLPVATNSVVNVGDRVIVARTPSTAVVIGGGGSTAPPPPPPVVVVPPAPARSWTFEPIVRDTDGVWLSSFNGVGFAQDYMFTDVDGTMYAIWYDKYLNPEFGRKRTTDLDWAIKDLSTIAGNPLSAPITTDGHNYTTFGIDGETGLIHVTGNMHAQPLNYMRSTKGVNDPTFNWATDWTAAAMEGGRIESVTYPMFHRMPSGLLLFVYRNGASGDGDTFIKYWSGGVWNNFGIVGTLATNDLGEIIQGTLEDQRDITGGQTFTDTILTAPTGTFDAPADLTKSKDLHARVINNADIPRGAIIASVVSSAIVILSVPTTGSHIGSFTVCRGFSAYLLPPAVDSSGNLDLMWCHRVTGSASSNNGWYYAKITGLTAGGTMAAQRSDGSPITLPIGAPGAIGGITTSDHWPEKIADFPAPFVINDSAPGALEPCDPAGYPHAAFMAIDPINNSVQHYHIFRDATGWHVDQITSYGNWNPPADWSSSTPGGDASRMKIVCTPAGQVLAIGHWPAEGRRGALWCYDLTTRDLAHGYIANTNALSPPAQFNSGTLTSGIDGFWFTKTVNQPFKLHALPDQGDFHYAFESALDNKLRILITSSSQRYYHDPGLNSQYGNSNPQVSEKVPTGWVAGGLELPAGMLGVFTADLTQLDKFKNRDCGQLATIRMVSESTGGGIIVPTNLAAFTPGGELLQFNPSYAGASSPGGRVDVWVSDSNGGPNNHHVIVFDETAAGAAVGSGGDGNTPIVIVPNSVSGAMLFARMFVEMRVEGGTPSQGYVAATIFEIPDQVLSPSHTQTSQSGNERVAIATCWNDCTPHPNGGSNVAPGDYSDTTVFTTSWAALRAFSATSPAGATAFGGILGRLTVGAKTGNLAAGTRGRIISVTIQLGMLEV